jgi:hypothetical protein
MMNTTIRFALMVEDKVNSPQRVWMTKDGKPTAYGPGSRGAWYDGWKVGAFGSEDKCRALGVKLRRAGASVRLEKRTYRGNVLVRIDAVRLDTA